MDPEYEIFNPNGEPEEEFIHPKHKIDLTVSVIGDTAELDLPSTQDSKKVIPEANESEDEELKRSDYDEEDGENPDFEENENSDGDTVFDRNDRFGDSSSEASVFGRASNIEVTKMLECNMCQKVPKIKESVHFHCCSFRWCRPCAEAYLEQKTACPQCKKGISHDKLTVDKTADDLKNVLAKSICNDQDEVKEEPDLCPTHKLEAEFFCELCEVIICVKCVTSKDHKGHSFGDLKEKFEDYLEKAGKIYHSLEKKQGKTSTGKDAINILHRQSLQNYKGSIEKIRELVNAHLDEISEEAEEKFDSHKKAVNKKASKIVRFVDGLLEANPLHKRARDVTTWEISSKPIQEVEDITVNLKSIDSLTPEKCTEFLYPILSSDYTFTLTNKHLDAFNGKQVVKEEDTADRPYLEFEYNVEQGIYYILLNVSNFMFGDAAFCVNLENEELKIKCFQLRKISKKEKSCITLAVVKTKKLLKKLETQNLDFDVSVNASDLRSYRDILSDSLNHVKSHISQE